MFDLGVGAGFEFVAGDRLEDAGVGFLVADLVVLPPPEDADPQGWGENMDGKTDVFLAELPAADGWPLAAEEGSAVVDDGALGFGNFFSPCFSKQFIISGRRGVSVDAREREVSDILLHSCMCAYQVYTSYVARIICTGINNRCCSSNLP